MSYEPGKREFGWVSCGTLAVFAALFLPMAASVAQPAAAIPKADDVAEAPDDDGLVDDNGPAAAPSARAATPYPQIVRTVPKSGATGVDPKIDAISVTFDRPMQKGMSWTGGQPHFPPTDEASKPHWKDDRTCLLPVRLAKGQFYRLGINSMSFANFRDVGGTATPPSVICFTTKGAKKSMERRVRIPKILELIPTNGQQDVDPTIKALRVTFDVPMGEGLSWTGGGPQFPHIPKGKQPRWSRDGRTCILPVELEPNSSYRLGLNSLSHNNFQSKWGVPLKPVRYEFSTHVSN